MTPPFANYHHVASSLVSREYTRSRITCGNRNTPVYRVNSMVPSGAIAPMHRGIPPSDTMSPALRHDLAKKSRSLAWTALDTFAFTLHRLLHLLLRLPAAASAPKASLRLHDSRRMGIKPARPKRRHSCIATLNPLGLLHEAYTVLTG
jgi:hypothetical protein